MANVSHALLPPPFLRKGDLVHAVAPAGHFDAAAVTAGLEVLRGWGLEVVMHQQHSDGTGVYAGAAQLRASALQAALADPDARAIWAIRGGSGTAQALVHAGELVWPKRWLVGFSDITTLHLQAFAQGHQSIHGAVLHNLAGWQPLHQNELWGLLSGDVRSQQFVGSKLIAGQAQGRLIGGNLTVLASLAGTELLPSLAGAVLLLEDIAEPPYRLARALFQLVHSGALDGIVGVAIGQLTQCGPVHEPQPHGRTTALHLLADLLAPLGIPVVSGLQLGHEPTSRAVPLGAMAWLDGHAGVLEVGQL